MMGDVSSMAFVEIVYHASVMGTHPGLPAEDIGKDQRCHDCSVGLYYEARRIGA
jgi:hypothetical protein